MNEEICIKVENSEDTHLTVSSKKLHDLLKEINALQDFLTKTETNINKINIDWINSEQDKSLAVVVQQDDARFLWEQLSELTLSIHSVKTLVTTISIKLNDYDIQPQSPFKLLFPKNKTQRKNSQRQRKITKQNPNQEKKMELELSRLTVEEIKIWIPNYSENQNLSITSRPRRKITNSMKDKSFKQEKNTEQNCDFFDEDESSEYEPNSPDYFPNDPEFQINDDDNDFSDCGSDYKHFGTSPESESKPKRFKRNNFKSKRKRDWRSDGETETDNNKNVKITKRTFPCGQGDCPKIFTLRHNRAHHIKIFHNKKIGEDEEGYRCPHCSTFIAKEKKTIYKHIQNFHPGKEIQSDMFKSLKPFKCTFPNCDQSFRGVEGKKIHESTHSADGDKKDFICEECGATFRVAKYLKVHQKVVHLNQNKNNPCQFCPQRFTVWEHMVRHVQKEHPDKPSPHHSKSLTYKCDLCNVEYKCRKTLKNHMITTHTSLPLPTFPCELCDKVYKDPSGYNRHKRTHAINPDYVCKFCDKLYTRTSRLKRHVLINHASEEEKNAARSLCPQCGALVFELKHHLRVVHLNVKKSNKCKFCSKVFSSKKDLTVHLELHEKEKNYLEVRSSGYQQFGNQSHEQQLSNRSSSSGDVSHYQEEMNVVPNEQRDCTDDSIRKASSWFMAV